MRTVRRRFHLVGVDHGHQGWSHLQYERAAGDEASDTARIDLAVPGPNIDGPAFDEARLRAPTWRYGPNDSTSKKIGVHRNTSAGATAAYRTLSII